MVLSLYGDRQIRKSGLKEKVLDVQRGVDGTKVALVEILKKGLRNEDGQMAKQGDLC